MIALVLFLTCVFVATAVGLMAAWSDFKGMIIPNWYSLAILLSFAACFVFMMLLGHGDVFQGLVRHIIAGVVLFLVTAVLFALRTMGAGDAKLMTVFAFWVGSAGIPPFLFYMALMGGLLAVATIFVRKYKPFKAPPAGSWLAKAQAEENKVPYGIAITFGALASFYQLGYFSSAVMTILG